MRHERVIIFSLAVLLIGLTYFAYLHSGVKYPSTNAAGARSVTYPFDGQGEESVSTTDPVIAGSFNSWIITYTAGRDGIRTGGGVALHIYSWRGWSAPQSYDPATAGYTTAFTDADGVELKFLVDPEEFYALALVSRGKLKAGQKIIFVYGAPDVEEGSKGNARTGFYAEEGMPFLIETDGNGDGRFAPVKRFPQIKVVGGEAESLVVIAPSMAVVDEPFRVTIAALDAYRNRSQFYESNFYIKSIGSPADAPEEVFMPQKALGAVSFTAVAGEEGIAQFEIKEAEGGATAVSNPVRVYTERPKYYLFWGHLHGHTRFSGGTGTPEDFYDYAYNVSRLDVAAITDNDHWGFSPLDERPEAWERIKRAAKDAYEPGEFVTLLGYEFTDWRYGHYHVLYDSDEGPLFSAHNPNTDDPRKLWASLSSRKAITVPLSTGGNPQATNWSFFEPIFEPLVEVENMYEVSERSQTPSAIYDTRPGHFALDAIARGYRLGFIGGGDDHNGHPGIRDFLASTGGITGIWAGELTRDAIWEALKARRTYATTGARIYLEFHVNGVLMGGNLRLDNPYQDRLIQGSISGTAPIAVVELIKNGDVLATWRPMTEAFEFSVNENLSASKNDYYYLRIYQADNEVAWSSPVWIDLP